MSNRTLCATRASLAILFIAFIKEAPIASRAPAAAPTPASGTIRNDEALPGTRFTPTRKDIEDLIRLVGRDPVSEELVDRIDALFRPRGSLDRVFDNTRRHVTDPEVVAQVDRASILLTDKPADTRSLLYRLTVRFNLNTDGLLDEMRDDYDREAAPRKTIKGRVIDVETSKPIEGAVIASISGMMARTDANGNYSITTRPPKSTNPLGITIEAPGYALTQTYFGWRDMGDEVTSDHSLIKAKPLGGQVVDPNGKPIAGARIDLQLDIRKICRDGSTQRLGYTPMLVLLTESGPDGRFVFGSLPPELFDRTETLSYSVAHPEFESTNGAFRNDGAIGERWTLKLETGCRVSGVVEDESGKPVANASVRIYLMNAPSQTKFATTDAAGKFKLGGLWVGPSRVVVQPRDGPFVSQDFNVEVATPVALKITTQAGSFLKGTVLGEDGKPASNCIVGWLHILEQDDTLKTNDEPINRFVRTLDDGTFRLGPVLSGRYQVRGLSLQAPHSTGFAKAETSGKDVVIELKSGAK